MEYRASYADSLRADILPSYKDSLTHHGIKGQKWGVRRFQNEDGTLTPEGEKRYLKDLNRAANDEMVSSYFMQKHAANVDQLTYYKEKDPVNFKKNVPRGLLEQETSKLNEWTARNKKDVERVQDLMSKMKFNKKHLAYNVVTGTYSIEKDK